MNIYPLEVPMHWYIVASQIEARIFVRTSERPQLKLLQALPNPLGRVKKRDLIRKQAGHGVKSLGRLGAAHYSEPKRHDPHEEAMNQFAKEIVQFLERGKFKKSFNSLSIIAEPHLLGKIRSEMKTDLKESVVQWIKKDWQKTPMNKLIDLLLRPKPVSDDSFRSAIT